MRDLLNQGIDAIRNLPQERQDAAGEFLLSIAAPEADQGYSFTPAQIADIREAVRDADRGQLASDEEVTALWRYCGL